MVAAPNVILLPPPAPRRGEDPRVDNAANWRRTAARNDNSSAFSNDFAPARDAAAAAEAYARQRPRARSFADELVGESGRAPPATAFAAQRIAQERLGRGAYIENWRTATAAYAQTVRNAEQNLGGLRV
jgi:hypothetical protein